jgi:hypothetical protein
MIPRLGVDTLNFIPSSWIIDGQCPKSLLMSKRPQYMKPFMIACGLFVATGIVIALQSGWFSGRQLDNQYQDAGSENTPAELTNSDSNAGPDAAAAGQPVPTDVFGDGLSLDDEEIVLDEEEAEFEMASNLQSGSLQEPEDEPFGEPDSD